MSPDTTAEIGYVSIIDETIALVTSFSYNLNGLKFCHDN